MASTGSLSGVLFSNLRVLRMKSNLLEYPVLLLPRVKELHLSHNNIRRLPPMQGVPCLEVLILSHNQIQAFSKDKEAWQTTRALRSIDVSFNKIDALPSELAAWLRTLKHLDGLQWVQLRGNIFCTYFSEYQALVTKLLPTLTKVDDVNLARMTANTSVGHGEVRSMRAELEAQADFCFGRTFPDVWINGQIVDFVDRVEQFDTIEDAAALVEERVGAKFKEPAEAKQFFFRNRLKMLDATIGVRKGFEENANLGMDKRELQLQAEMDEGGEQTCPLVTELVQEFDEALAGHSSMQTSVQLVFEQASRLTGMAADRLGGLFEGKRDGKTTKEEVSMTLVQQIEMIYERFPDARPLLVRTLAKFAPVPQHRLGEYSIAMLGSIARGSDAGMQIVVDVIVEMLIPMLRDKHISDKSCETVVQGLGKLRMQQLADALIPMVNRLMLFLRSIRADANTNSKTTGALYGLIRCALTKPEAVEDVKKDLKELCNTVLNAERLTDQLEFELYVDATAILRDCIGHNPPECIYQMRLNEEGSSKVHNVLTDNVINLCRGRASEILQLPQCKKVGVALDLLTDLLIHDEGIQRDLLDSPSPKDNRLVTLLSRICSQVPADPILLTAALRGLREILSIKVWRERYLKQVNSELALASDENIVISYIEETRFKGLHRSCEMHVMQTEKETGSGDAKASALATSTFELSSCTNHLTHAAIVSIVRFLNVFSVLGSSAGNSYAADLRLCKQISSQIDELGREALLFKLLEVPSSHVQETVIECIGSTEISQLDDNDFMLMIDLLNPSRIAVEEKLLGSVMTRLTAIIEMEGAAADKFRSKHAQRVIHKTFEVISRNAERPTYSNMDEERQKVKLGRQAVALIAAASRQPLLRCHLRGQGVVDDMRGMLKNEEKLNSYMASDIFVELTWTGRNVEYLANCLGGMDAVDCRRKQGFRIVHRIANVLCGLADVEGALPEDTSAMAQQETLMWHDRKIRRDFCRDDNICEDTTKQQEMFTTFMFLERIINFLESRLDFEGDELSEKPLTKTFQLQKQASKFVTWLRESANTQHAKLDGIAKSERDREDAIEINVEDPPVVIADDTNELLLLSFMTQGQRVQSGLNGLTPTRGFARPRIPDTLRCNERFFIEGAKGEVDAVYPLSAFLRGVYALLVVPTVEKFRSQTIRQLRAPSMQLRLVALVKSCGSLVNCHVAAKLLRVLEEALKLMPGQAVVGDEKAYVGSLLVAAKFASSCLETLSPLLEDPGGLELTEQQLTLCTEALRLLRSVASALVRLHLSDTPNVQEDCVQAALGHALSYQTIRAVVLSLLYDLELGAGRAHGRNITDAYLGSSLARGGMRQMAAELLSLVLDAYPKMRYEVLELMSYYEAVGRHHMRESCRSDLLARVNAHKYRVAMQRMLQERNRPDERILLVIDMELPKIKGRTGGRIAAAADAPAQMLVLTTLRILIMGRPKHKALQAKCGHCPPESFCPIGPSIEDQYKYLKLTRVIVGPDRQTLILGWMRRGGNGEDFDVIVCHKSDERKAVADALCFNSGQGVEDRITPSQDTVIARAVQQATGSNGPPLAWHYAVSKPGTSDSRLSLFVLTESDFFEFEVIFDNWLAPFEETPHTGHDDVHSFGRDIAQGQLWLPVQLPSQVFDEKDDPWNALAAQGDVDEPPPKALKALESKAGGAVPPPPDPNSSDLKSSRDRAIMLTAQEAAAGAPEMSQEERQDAALKRSQERLLKLLDRASLENLSEVEFSSGDVPLLGLSFSASKGSAERQVHIRFLDDVAREEWRMGIAFAISRSEEATWQRGWNGRSSHVGPTVLV
eukprot:TRINITY_DN25763_c0_g1_i2.p1 TRINITY_DN25763_c0_g1~~TRINITY_DN25763_c0_g1_i2.p1  ORF type:complete len:2017 (-),score=504.50 TRINITY_DN25763_c0_g1_i2:157-5598(-)